MVIRFFVVMFFIFCLGFSFCYGFLGCIDTSVTRVHYSRFCSLGLRGIDSVYGCLKFRGLWDIGYGRVFFNGGHVFRFCRYYEGGLGFMGLGVSFLSFPSFSSLLPDKGGASFDLFFHCCFGLGTFVNERGFVLKLSPGIYINNASFSGLCVDTDILYKFSVNHIIGRYRLRRINKIGSVCRSKVSGAEMAALEEYLAFCRSSLHRYFERRSRFYIGLSMSNVSILTLRFNVGYIF